MAVRGGYGEVFSDWFIGGIVATFSIGDRMHRLVKEALDSGTATSLAEAEAMFRGFCIGFDMEPEAALRPHHQAALLTGVALAKRVFLGGVSVSAPSATPLTVPLPLGATLGEAVRKLGGHTVSDIGDGPRITIGSRPRPRSSDRKSVV